MQSFANWAGCRYPMLRERGDKGFRIESRGTTLTRASRNEFVRATPKRIAFFVTSRGVTNEIYYMAQKVARFLGTNNVDNAARLCHSPSTGAMKYALGVAASTCSYKDWFGTDLIVFFGANPANDQPVTTKYLHLAKKLGTKIVLVNPYLEPGMKRYWVPSNADSALFGTNMTDYWFPVSQGGDIAFLYGVLKVLVERDWLNHEFISQTHGRFSGSQISTLNARLSGPGTRQRPDARGHGGIRRAASRREERGVRLEHGHHAAHVRRRCRVDDSESRARARLCRPRQMRADADSRPFERARRRGDGRVRDGVSRRQTDQRGECCSGSRRSTDFRFPIRPG